MSTKPAQVTRQERGFKIKNVTECVDDQII